MRCGTYFATDGSSAGACEGAKLACAPAAAGGAPVVAAAIGAAAGAAVLGDSVLATSVPGDPAGGCDALSAVVAGEALAAPLAGASEAPLDAAVGGAADGAEAD